MSEKRAATSLTVVPVQVPVRVKPNHLYVITPGISLLIRNGVLSPSELTGEGGHYQHLFDQFLESLASDLKERAVGVILSGAGSDGSAGISAIKNHGGITLAQDDTAIFPSMPTSAILTGAVDFILPPFLIAQKIVSLHQPAVGLENGGPFSEDALQAEKEEDSVVQDDYRKVVATLSGELRRGKNTVPDQKGGSWSDHVQVIRLDADRNLNGNNLKRGSFLKDFGKNTFMGGVKMLKEYIDQTTIGRNSLQEFVKCRKPPGRGHHTDNIRKFLRDLRRSLTR